MTHEHRDIPNVDVETLGKYGTLREFADGQPLFSEGDPAGGFYLHREGEIDFMRNGRLADHCTGSCVIGLEPFHAHATHPTTALAHGRVTAYFIDRPTYESLTDRFPILSNLIEGE